MVQSSRMAPRSSRDHQARVARLFLHEHDLSLVRLATRPAAHPACSGRAMSRPRPAPTYKSEPDTPDEQLQISRDRVLGTLVRKFLEVLSQRGEAGRQIDQIRGLGV
jgi:hypothetical protein